jgi:hypothetical protein
MKTLEQLAREAFQEFAIKKMDTSANWHYLSPERKAQWMKEISDIYEICVKQVIDSLKTGANNVSGAASYERGFAAGQAHEANRIFCKMEYIKEEMKRQLADFIARTLKQ